MAGQPITRKRMEKIEEAGEDRVFDLWLELKSVKKVMQAIGFEDEEVSSAHRAFYRWVKMDEDRKQRWDELREVGGHAAAEEIADVVDSATVENTNLARLRVDHLKWRAESLNKGYGKQQGNNVTVNVTAQNAWLGALREAEQIHGRPVRPAVEEADYVVLSQGEREPRGGTIGGGEEGEGDDAPARSDSPTNEQREP